MLDLVIRNGIVVDGVKTKRFQADVGIQGDRIVQIGLIDDEDARQTVDARGMIVAPGFIDVHNHSDAWLLKTPHFFSKTSQGFTTEVIMADGISYAPVNQHTVYEWIYYLRALNGLRFDEYEGWSSLADYMALLNGHNVQNTIAHIPYANVRTLACGFGSRPPDDYQMRIIREEIARGMEAGAVGVSTGLDYVAQCFASADELVEACKIMAPEQGLYVTHMRYKLGLLPALQEAVYIGRRAGVPVHISHLKAASESQAEEVLDYIDKVAVNEVDFSFDVYPYLPGSTMLNYLLPYDVWEDGPLGVLPRLRQPAVRTRFAHHLHAMKLEDIHIAWVQSKENSHHQGKSVADYVREQGLPAEDALCNLLIEENLAVLLVFHQGDDAVISPFLSHRLYMMGTDGIYHEDGVIHPRQYGSVARILGACVRDQGLFSLEEAVFKLTGYPAARFGLRNRGYLREGAFADVVVFDPQQIQDQATYTQPHALSIGVEHVVVNGALIVQDAAPVDMVATPLPGQALRFRR
ncbi:MAG: amidohydrolase family protein [Caldilineaceae bacterium]|nr:amidohydrolase family protein [Caldilineaceae bacterium]